MDPTNTNLAPTTPPAPQPGGQPDAAPAGPSIGSTAPNLQPISSESLTPQTQPSPVAPASPTAPAAPTAPVPPVPPVSPAPSPAAPVAPQPAAPTAPLGASPVPGVPLAAPVNPIINPGAHAPQNSVGATEAILRPDPITPPDPVEEELKAPMRAAAPAPGSIGSAVSGPAGDIDAAGGQTPSVSFNDPAVQPNMTAAKAPKKSNKTLVVLIVIALIVVLALCGILAWQFLAPQPAPSGGTNPNSSIVEPEQNSETSDNTSADDTPVDTGSTTVASLTCTKTTSTANADSAAAGSSTTKINAAFSEGRLTSVSLESTSSTDASATPTTKESTAADLTVTTAQDYSLPTEEDGTVDLDLEDIRSNYERLDFVCEAL